ncbi:MAG: hypothetical protein ABI690_14815 [Chloroflexota bacterium]
MRTYFRLSLLTLVLTGLFVFANSPAAVNASSNSCDSLNGKSYGPVTGDVNYFGQAFNVGDTFTITHNGTAAQVTVEAPAGTPVAVIPQGGSATFTIKTAGITSLSLRNLTGTGTISGGISCGDASAIDPNAEVLFNPGDGRINHHVADRAAPAAVYCQYAGVQVIRIDPVTAKGTDEIRLTAAEIADAGVPTDGNIILAKTDWAIVARLADGRFSLSTWYADGKPYTIIWGECSLESIEYVVR